MSMRTSTSTEASSSKTGPSERSSSSVIAVADPNLQLSSSLAVCDLLRSLFGHLNKAQGLRSGVGTGLVGSAVRWVIENEPPNSRFGRKEDEEWVFLSSKDCDLR